MFIIGIVDGLLGVFRTHHGPWIAPLDMGRRGKTLTDNRQEGVFGETYGSRDSKVGSQLAHMGQMCLVYLTDVGDDQNVGSTYLRHTEREQFFQLLEEDIIVLLPLV